MNSERRALRREEWQQLISEHKQSGLSVKVFCEERGVSEPSFYTWRKRLVEDQPTRFALVATNGVAPTRPALHVVLAGGERLEIPPGVDPATLRTVLALLREGA
jgi:transposase-like protein